MSHFYFLFLLICINLCLPFLVPQGDYFRPNSWWVSRNNQKMDYWGGALPGSRKCECGILGNCADPTKWCNCDAGLEGWLEDDGDITEKEYLPVKQLRFGDTGTPLDEKEGRYTLGPLVCEGDGEFIDYSFSILYSMRGSALIIMYHQVNQTHANKIRCDIHLIISLQICSKT